MFKTLISTDVLAARLADPSWVIVDRRFKLDDGVGGREWTAAHIPVRACASGSRPVGPKTDERTSPSQTPRVARTSAASASQVGQAGYSMIKTAACSEPLVVVVAMAWPRGRRRPGRRVRQMGGGGASNFSRSRAARRREGRVSCGAAARRHDDRHRRRVGARTRRGLAPARRAGAGALSRRGRTDGPGGRTHSGRGESFLSAEYRRARTLRTPEDLRARFAHINGIAPEHIVCYCGSGVRRATTCSRSSTRVYQERSCIRDRGVSG